MGWFRDSGLRKCCLVVIARSEATKQSQELASLRLFGFFAMNLEDDQATGMGRFFAALPPPRCTDIARFHHSADAFIAFLGLDVRVRESGRFRGQRKLTKRGNPQLRRLVFNGARSGSRTRHRNDTYGQFRERGLSTTAATVAVARELARLVFAILGDQTSYQAKPSTA